MEGLTEHKRALAADGGRAAEVIQGLANLSAFLAAHADLPLARYGDALYVSINAGTDEEDRAEVDRIGRILGVAAQGDEGHYRVSRDFGGGVTYKAFAVTTAALARHAALNTYTGAVEPEMAATA